MLLEQEAASIMSFAIKSAGDVAVYYYDVPESFKTPSMYFPQPEIVTSGETFGTYAARYAWYINVFHDTTEEAFAIAWEVLTALKRARNYVPLLDEDGGELTGAGSKLRLDDPSVKVVDVGVAQITLGWTSRRPYDREDSETMQEWSLNLLLR